MDYRNYITLEPNKRGGKHCVRGLRITVYEVLEYLASEIKFVKDLELIAKASEPDDWKNAVEYIPYR